MKRNTRKRRRIATIFLLPVLPIIFLTGWILYFFGRPAPKKPQTLKTPTKQKELQMGLLAEIEEEQKITV